MPRTRAVLSDPDRSLLQDTLMDDQAFHERQAAHLARQVREHIQQAKAAQKAQQRITAAAARQERLEWDGENCRRRQSDRRSHDFADAA